MSNSSINIKSNKICGENLGSGEGVFAYNNPFNTLNFKSLVGAGTVSISGGFENIIISGTNTGGESNTASNLGSGAGVYSTKVGEDLRFKSILGFGNVVIEDLGTEISISGASAEVSAAGSFTEIQYNGSTGNTLGANPQFTFKETTKAFTLGTRATGTDGCASFTQGLDNIASGHYSSAQGRSTQAIGVQSHAEGYRTCAVGVGSHSEGFNTKAFGCASHSGGKALSGKEIIACGNTSFNHSYNNAAQTAGYGATAIRSTILGGINHHIAVGNTGAAIIGGNCTTLTGTSYIDTTAVSNFAVMCTPNNNVTSDQVLVRNTSTGIIEYVSKASLGGSGSTTNPAGSDTQIQFNDGGAFGADPQLVFDKTTNSLTLGNRAVGSCGTYSFGLGNSNIVSGNFSFSSGCLNVASGIGSHAQGRDNIASGTSSHAEGLCTVAGGDNSRSSGRITCAMGNGSNTQGSLTIACGTYSHAEGCNTKAYGVNSHAEGSLTIACGHNSHAEGINSRTYGGGSHSEGYNTISCGKGSHSEGCNSCAIGIISHAEGSKSCAIGDCSHAEGNTTKAFGCASHSEGFITCAIGNNSHAEGTCTFSCAIDSHSEGCKSCAIGNNSHAEGGNTKAFGNSSHSEGNGTWACGVSAHGEGTSTTASGHSAHSEGHSTWAIGNCSHSQGSCTCALGENSHSSGRGHPSSRYIIADGKSAFNHSYNCFSQTIGHGALANFSAILGGCNHHIVSTNTGAAIIGGSNIKLTGIDYINTTAVSNLAIMSIPTNNITSDQVLVRNISTGKVDYVSKASLGGGTPAGADTQIQFNDGGAFGADAQLKFSKTTNSLTLGTRAAGVEGSFSFSQGTLSIASGDHSHSEGCRTCAIGKASHSEGACNVASGNYSHVEGWRTCAIGIRSHAEGSTTCATGLTAHAEGSSTIAGGDQSHAEGSTTCAFGLNSHAEGSFTCAFGLNSHAEGCKSIAIGCNSHAEGFCGIACGRYSHAENRITLAYGQNSHAEGRSTKACGANSHAEGYCTCAIADVSHAQGWKTCASGKQSHAEGTSTIASGVNSHAEGNVTEAIGLNSHAEGQFSHACGTASHVEGNNAIGHGFASHAEGVNTDACGSGSHAEGCYTEAIGTASHSGGRGLSTKEICATGFASFNHSYNSTLGVVGDGAKANFSAILGGCNHNIEAGNIGAAIIGGGGAFGIKLTGTDYVDTTAVGKLAIFTTPVAGGTDDVLTWNSTTKKIGKVTQASVPSDGRLKTNLQPIENALDGIIGLNGYEYEFNDLMQPESMVGQKRYGLIAQEVEAKFPLVVRDNIHFDDKTYKSVEYRELVPILVQAIKELEERIKTLEK